MSFMALIGSWLRALSNAERPSHSLDLTSMGRLLTIGHGLLGTEEFVAHLRRNGVQRVVDVRSVPFSRRAPQFNQPALAARLRREGIDYVWAEALGGRPSMQLRTSGGAPN